MAIDMYDFLSSQFGRKIIRETISNIEDAFGEDIVAECIGATQLLKLSPNQQLVKSLLEHYEINKRGRTSMVPQATIQNFTTIFSIDHKFSCVFYNELSRKAVVVGDDGKVREWDATDDAEARCYIEHTYEIHNQSKHKDAFVQFLRDHSYNPLKNIVKDLRWDGKERCKDMLHKWLKAEDSPYVQEVSRLLFAGGIHRLFDPGCKFDCVPVLIGKQGSGKSTFCRWLALGDDYYNSLTTIKDQKGAEAISGVWVCEIEELVALTSNSRAAAEKAKAFVSRQDEYYREPYANRSAHHKRTCIFIGTTNQDEFITDKTGARRWFPVKTASIGSDLYDNIEACQEDIKQAWAEMYHAYLADDPLASLVPSKAVADEIKRQQESISEDDWRVGVIEDYLKDKDRVCILQIWTELLSKYGFTRPLTSKDSKDIGNILVNQLGWRRGYTETFDGICKRQKAFYRVKEEDKPEASAVGPCGGDDNG